MNYCIHRKRLVLLSILLTFVGGCSVAPEPLSKDEIKNWLHKDRIIAYDGVEPVTAPLTLYDSVARAMKYNLNYKIKVMEAAIGLVEQQAVTFDMLPDLVANTSYTNLSNNRALASPVSGQTSTARNRDTNYYDLNLTWNILDFGISYYNAKQKSNEYLILEEKKRTMLQEIVRDTRTAYWASHVSKAIMPQALRLSKQVLETIGKSKKQEQEKVIEKERAAKYRIQLWETNIEINKMVHNLERAKLAFAALINVPTYQDVPLEENQLYKLQRQHLPYSIRELEILALHNRPEIREEILQNKINIDEVYKARIKLIPNFTLVFAGNYDSTTYLVDQFWRETSLKLTWNLFKLFSRYYEVELAKGREDLGHVRRQALAVSILTQLNVAYARIKEADWHHKIAKGLFDDNLVLYEDMKNRKKNDLASELDLMQTKVAYIESKFKLLSSHYDRLNAYNELLDAVGYNSINQVTGINQSVSDISKQVEASFNNVEGFYITYDEIKSRYADNKSIFSSENKKLIDEVDADQTMDPRLLKDIIDGDDMGLQKSSTKQAQKIIDKSARKDAAGLKTDSARVNKQIPAVSNSLISTQSMSSVKNIVIKQKASKLLASKQQINQQALASTLPTLSHSLSHLGKAKDNSVESEKLQKLASSKNISPEPIFENKSKNKVRQVCTNGAVKISQVRVNKIINKRTSEYLAKANKTNTKSQIAQLSSNIGVNTSDKPVLKPGTNVDTGKGNLTTDNKTNVRFNKEEANSDTENNLKLLEIRLKQLQQDNN